MGDFVSDRIAKFLPLEVFPILEKGKGETYSTPGGPCFPGRIRHAGGNLEVDRGVTDGGVGGHFVTLSQDFPRSPQDLVFRYLHDNSIAPFREKAS